MGQKHTDNSHVHRCLLCLPAQQTSLRKCVLYKVVVSPVFWVVSAAVNLNLNSLWCSRLKMQDIITVWVCICWPAHTDIESYKTSLKADCLQTAVLQLWPVAGGFAMHHCLQRLLEVHPQSKGKWNSDFHVPDLQVLFPFWKHLIIHPVFLFKKKVVQMRSQCRSNLFLY